MKYKYFLLTSKQTTNLASTNKTIISRFRIPLPAITEQAEILDNLGKIATPVSEVITRTEHEISPLSEYQTRLTADVVTGKLDVREAARHLPEDSGEAEPAEGIDDLEGEEDLNLESDGEALSRALG